MEENEVLPNSAIFTCDSFINMYNYHKIYPLLKLSWGNLNLVTSYSGNSIVNSMSPNLMIGSIINWFNCQNIYVIL